MEPLHMLNGHASPRNTVSRAMHDAGLSAWFGGTLANAVALNRASSEVGDEQDTGRVVNVGWNSWTPVNAGAIALHLIGSVGQLAGNMDRIRSQPNVAAMTALKTALTAAALGVTAYSRALGKRVAERVDIPAQSGTEPTRDTPVKAAEAQRRLNVLQWVVPALTGALVVVSAFAGEQQRSSRGGILGRILG
ncbi:MAG TPA: hypothetical protein VI076_16980 [Actinopolymorphaceae bacterium]